MQRILQLIYLMLPVYAANMAPPFVRYWPGRVRPISERWLGSHKTWLGYAFAIVAATAVTLLQWRLDWSGGLVDYAQWAGLGLACGLGAMLGDSAKSLVKRRLGIAPGQRWVPADQLDFVVGGLVALAQWVELSRLDVVLVLGLSFIGTVVVNRLAYVVGVKDVPW
jgi:CDP-2,3-bis-(O-geranylgeranyl)-sn-glycerol synthase